MASSNFIGVTERHLQYQLDLYGSLTCGGMDSICYANGKVVFTADDLQCNQTPKGSHKLIDKSTY